MKRALLCVFLLALAVSAGAQEKLTLTAPISKPSIAEWSIAKFEVNVENAEIVVTVKGDNGEYKTVRYESAATLINSLNTANLTIKSLRRRILERLQADGHLGAGNFSGGN
jgi:hypothetical protein